MNLRTILKHFKLDMIIGLDFETYWADGYTLSSMATTEYIIDPQFKMHMVSVQANSDKQAYVLDQRDLKRKIAVLDWDRIGMLAHHTHFDGLIASYHFGIRPKMYFDTLSMARPVMPVTVGGSLDALCRAFKLKGKVGAEHLLNTKGVRDLSAEQYKKLAAYAGNDIEQTWQLFHKLMPYTTMEELELIDLTVKMYAQPVLLMDGEITNNVQVNELKKKGAHLDQTKAYCRDLMSNPKFAELLAKAGVEERDIPRKLSKRTNEITYAFAKTDLAFKALLKHKRKRVRDLVAARLALKTTGLETRAERFTQRSTMGAQPVYLGYWAAKTGRWGGGDKANWQNLASKRIEGGTELRSAIHAPRGKVLLIADLAQIEARINAWKAGQHDILKAFADKQDVYKLAAARIYGKSLEAITPEMRFVGKVAVLALGYQAGAARFANMLRVGSFGPPVDISDAESDAVVQAWRAANHFIVASWKRAENNARSAFFNGIDIDDGVLTYEGVNGNGFIHLPGGMAIRYDNLRVNDEGMAYVNKHRNKKDGTVSEEVVQLYGGILVENYTQALARRVIAEHILELTHQLQNARIAMTTHDEVVFVVPQRFGDHALRVAHTVMSTPPDWAPDLPLAVDAHISERYDK